MPEENVKLIRMEREDRTADVHPDEEQNYANGGWVRVEGSDDVEIIPAKMKKAEVVEELQKRGISPDKALSVDELREMLQKSLDTPLVDFAAGAANKAAEE